MVKQNSKRMSRATKKIVYNMDILRQTAGMVVSKIVVDTFASLFKCTMVGRSSA